jgi:hypothetical protein
MCTSLVLCGFPFPRGLCGRVSLSHTSHVRAPCDLSCVTRHRILQINVRGIVENIQINASTTPCNLNMTYESTVRPYRYLVLGSLGPPRAPGPARPREGEVHVTKPKRLVATVQLYRSGMNPCTVTQVTALAYTACTHSLSLSDCHSTV